MRHNILSSVRTLSCLPRTAVAFAAIFSCIFVIGCARADVGLASHDAARVMTSPKQLRELIKSTPTEIDVQLRLQKMVSEAEDRGCRFKDRYRACEMSQVSFQPAASKAGSVNQRILVLDEAFITPSLLMRHKSKMLDILLHSEAGDYHRAQPLFETPKVNLEMQLVLDETPAPIRNEALGDVAESMAAMNYLATKNVGEIASGTTHGEVVFETLAKYNPDAQFVVAPFPVISESLYCRIGDQDASAAIDEFYARALQTLLPRVQDLQVSHANISWAITDAGSFKKFESVCGSRPSREQRRGLVELVEAEAAFVRNLARLAKIMVVQASPNDYPGDFYDPKSPGTAWSCLGDSRILSVGYFGRLSSAGQAGLNIPRAGRKIESRLIPVQQALTAACVDLFVNGGISESRVSARDGFETGYNIWWNENSFIENILSFSSAPAQVLSNSWLTPVALSMLIHMQKENERQNRSVDAVDVAKMLRNKMFDPIVNHQFELYRGIN